METLQGQKQTRAHNCMKKMTIYEDITRNLTTALSVKFNPLLMWRNSYDSTPTLNQKMTCLRLWDNQLLICSSHHHVIFQLIAENRCQDTLHQYVKATWLYRQIVTTYLNYWWTRTWNTPPLGNLTHKLHRAPPTPGRAVLRWFWRYIKAIPRPNYRFNRSKYV